MSSHKLGIEENIAEAAFGAAAAIADLMGRALSGRPRCRRIEPADLIESILGPDDWVAAVVSELKGGAKGSAAILLSRPAVDQLLASLLGRGRGAGFDPRERSALCEAGNIAISAAAGALGSRAGSPVVPSLPTLGLGPAASVLAGLLELGTRTGSAVLLADSNLDGAPGSCVRFIWVSAP